MPRRSRLVIPGLPLHIIQRGNNRTPCFFGDSDCLVYLDALRECAEEADCDVHAYVLMSNHVHLLISPGGTNAPGAMMQRLGQRYVQYINRRHGRSGTLWEGRFHSCLIGDERYLLACQRYIELNPVRAAMVAEPGSYQWSSYRVNALGHPSRLLTPHPVYASLAASAEGRIFAYRELFSEALPARTLEQIRRATNGNYALGDEQLTGLAADSVGRTVVPRRPGRPKKPESNCTNNVL